MKMPSKRGSEAKHQAQGMPARGEWRTDKEARGWKSVQLGMIRVPGRGAESPTLAQRRR